MPQLRRGRDASSSRPRLDPLLRRIEAMRLRSTERHWALMPADLRHRNRADIAPIDDALSTLIGRSDSLRMNRVIGLGHRGAAQPASLDALIDRYRAARLKRFSLLLGPGPQAADIERWLDARGFARRGGHVLLIRDCRLPVAPLPEGLRVSRARGALLEDVVRIHGESFATPPSQIRWAMATAAARDNEHYLAFIGAAAAGVGTLRSDGDLAWLGGGATRTRWRRRGVHRALIAARLRRAAHLGCRWAWTETAEPGPGRPDGSRRNLLRFGFEQVCVQPIFVWEKG